jgi:predicted heme/steroid binding protein
MTIAELAKFDGLDGRAAYVAVGGVIYDVSTSQYWKEGDQEKGHQAGCDLTEELKSVPHLKAMIEGSPVVGKIERTSGQKNQSELKLPLLSILIIAFVVLLMLATYMI